MQLERAFRRYPAVVLSGMGGYGQDGAGARGRGVVAALRTFRGGRLPQLRAKGGGRPGGATPRSGVGRRGLQHPSRGRAVGAAVELFRRRRVLLVWDNFESTLPAYQEGEDGDSPVSLGSEERRRLRTLFRELTEGEPLGRLLVTCRPEETGLAWFDGGARVQGSALPPQAAEALAQLAGLPSPLDVVGTFLESVASGGRCRRCRKACRRRWRRFWRSSRSSGAPFAPGPRCQALGPCALPPGSHPPLRSHPHPGLVALSISKIATLDARKRVQK